MKLNHTTKSTLKKMTHPVKKNIWESFERALMAKSKVFIKDIASRLEIDESALVKEIFNGKNNIKTYLFDTCSDDCFCKAVVPIANGKFAARCRAPTHSGTSYCIQHQYSRPMIQTCIDHGIPMPRMLSRLKESDDLPPLGFNESGTVFDASLSLRGNFNKDTKKLIIAKLTPTQTPTPQQTS